WQTDGMDGRVVMSSGKRLLHVGWLMATALSPGLAPAAEFRDLAPVRVFPVELASVAAPKPLSPLPPDVGQGLKPAEGLRDSLFAPGPDDLDGQAVDWSYRQGLKPYRGYGIAGSGGG